MNDLAQQIEHLLLARRDWVASEEICSRFGLPDDRPFRQVGDHPGLCTAFAISSDKGFKHVSCATSTEWLRFKHRLRRHGIQELVRVRDLDRRRHEVTRQAAGLSWEKDTDQAVMAF